MNLDVLRTAAFLLVPVSLQAQTPASKPIDLLKQRLQTISQSVSADWGVYIKSLDSGEEIAINADRPMDTMSTIKIPLLVDVYRQVDAGKLNPVTALCCIPATSAGAPACCVRWTRA